MIDSNAAFETSSESKMKFGAENASVGPLADDRLDSSGELTDGLTDSSWELRGVENLQSEPGVAAQVDVVVIGMGPGGEFVAGELLDRGLKVVAIESELMGGECADWGCVPTKMMVRAANLLVEAGRVNGMAGSASVTRDWTPVAHRIREEATKNWNDGEAVTAFEKKGGRFIRGDARLVGASEESIDLWESESGAIGKKQTVSPARREVAVGDIRLSPRIGVVLATGGKSSAPDILGLDGLPYWTNRDVVQLVDLPGSLAILGGGAIAVELGQVLARFGVAVTIVEVADRLLASEEPEAGAMLEEVFRAEGIKVVTGATVDRVSLTDEVFELDLGILGCVRAERLLVATGRRPELGDLGVEIIGVDPTSSLIETDENMRVAPGIWAVGDVTGHGSFTHVATYQAHIAAADIVGEPIRGADYRAVPRVVYTDPEIGSVGMSEESARAKGMNVRIGLAPISKEARGWIHKVGNDGLIKLVEDRDREVLVGALSIGPCGGEVLALLTLAVHANVSTLTLKSMLYAYPTFHRAVETALADLH
jgi:pyruvate/2-oxoglutarate dehydrogenase complex dihydrolipoamide dehydrogenase (E3) component